MGLDNDCFHLCCVRTVANNQAHDETPPEANAVKMQGKQGARKKFYD